MTPDLETYGPFVQAVFGAPESEALRIPFSMADRSFLQAYPLYEAVLHLLSLSQSRFGAPQVLQVLESRAVQRRFGLSDGDLELVRLWITKTRIRWGKDAASRSQDGLPACGENTWEAGLERLLLGYAMPGDEGMLFDGVLPYGPMEGGAAQALGRFAQFMSVLFTLSDRLRGDKNLAAWSRLLQDMLADFFDPDSEDETHTLDTAREACAGLGRMQEISGFERELSLEVIREHLEKAFSQQVTGAGFLTGAVTVCAMLPMRSIPFKIICLLGMNDGLFPRVARPPAFDLIARHSQPCDRSVKKDDRYLFLETLLSAQQQLFISYTGQNMSDNSVIPPSTVVSQLLDYIEQGFICPDPEKPLREYMITKHRLQPFSPGYFEGRDLRSYSLRDFHCARAIRHGAAAEMPLFFSGDLAAAEDAFRTLTLDDLCRFLVNPCQYILQKRLGIYFDAAEDLIEDREPFALAGLERYTVEQELLERRLEGVDTEKLYPSIRAQGLLPHGMVGELVYDASVSKIDDFIEKIEPYRAHASAKPVALVLQAGQFTLTGTLSAVHSRTLVVYRYARAKPKDFLRAWIYHLALCASGTGDRSLLFALDAKDAQPTGWQFPRIDDAETLLGSLLDLYWQGLHRPLPLFPKASFAFADKLLGKNGDEQKALQAALDAFEGSDFTGGGDADDPYINICFPDGEFDEQEFMNLARSVYVTMMEHREKPGEE
jgi:exodeoxyribonuclease V gamma subunit